jgi:hypothetical protein
VVMRKRIGRSKVLEFFGDLSPCLVGLEAVHQRTIGVASCRRSATP